MWMARGAGAAIGRRPPFVLCYHGVGATTPGTDPHDLFIPSELFDHHLDTIEQRGYELVTVSELWRRLQQPGKHGNRVGAISFDDGLARTVHEAMPLLQARGLPSTMYVPTGLLGRRHPDLDGGEQIISASELVELAGMGVEIGAHSVDHADLTLLSYANALDQLRRSRATLEDLLSRPVTTMAYPFGAHNADTIRAAREAGYETACACSGAGPWNALSIPREPIYRTADTLRLRLKLAGLYGPVHWMKEARGRLGRGG
jgi:peptidoglycan/xylan/chitin deacetylase (PgdA/CDA1 family)